MKKCLLIINPYSGKMKMQNELLDVIKILNENNYLTTVQTTLKHNHARDIAKNSNGYDLIICSGGDGTLNQVTSGLIDGNHNIPLGYIPSGSTNDFANTLGIPSDIKTATKNIINGENFLIDVGEFNKNNYFNYVASFGILTSVSYNTSQSVKNMFGHMAYIFNGITDLINIKPYHIKCIIKNETIEDDYILGLVLNTTSVGGVLKLDKNIDVDLTDGLFEVILIKQPKDLIDCNKILDGIVNLNFSYDIFKFIKTNEIKFVMDNDISWSLDGEEKKPGKIVNIKNLQKRINILK